jgi:hypothetical protein
MNIFLILNYLIYQIFQGGQPDLIQASRIVLLDWNSG